MSRVADQICAEVDIRKALEYYGIHFNRRGYAICPFHQEKTPSLKVWNGRYKCFGCGASGSVIDFVMGYYGLTFGQAVVRLDSDFHLGISFKKPTYRERMAQAENRRLDERYQAWRAKLRKQHKNVCAIHSVLFRMVLDGEEWVEPYRTELEKLLETHSDDEVRRWPMIFK